MVKFCRKCSTLVPVGQWRAHSDRHRHPRGHWSQNRNRNDQAKFSRAVLARAGNQCQWIDENTGIRCSRTWPLDAHHTQPGNNDPMTGLALCSGPKGHHKAVDKSAR